MLAAVLGTRYRVHATRANLNNLVGVPLTILEAPEGTDALVVEAGANLPGEIARYREIIEPTLVVVTNAVAGHLEGFGSLAGVVEEKLSLTDGVALAIVGTDPPRWPRRARGAPGRSDRRPPGGRSGARPGRARFRRAAGADVRRTSRFTLAARGLHQADNAAARLGRGAGAGPRPAAVGRALERFALPARPAASCWSRAGSRS